MPKLQTYKSSEVARKLQNLGFVMIRHRKGSHAFYMNHVTKKTTVLPMHAGDIGRGLLRKIIRDCDIAIDDFIKA